MPDFTGASSCQPAAKINPLTGFRAVSGYAQRHRDLGTEPLRAKCWLQLSGFCRRPVPDELSYITHAGRGRAMSKKTIRKTTKPLSPRPAVKQDDTVYLVREDLDAEQERLKTTTGPGARPLQAPAPAAAAEQPPTPAAVPSKPLAPLAALWPDPVSPKGESKPVPAQASKPTAVKTVNVGFALHKPDAKQVLLGGDFNGWATGAAPMKRHENGHWETTVALAPGRYEYKFLVDGQWIPDPLARENVRNQHGTLNSVLEVRA